MLSTPCKSARARDEMLAFLRANHRPFTTVLMEAPELPQLQDENVSRVYSKIDPADLAYDPTREICVGDELAYGAGSSKIGFNFSTQGDYAHWMWTLCRWIALQVGRKRTFKTQLAYPTAFPYVTYDSEATPALTPAMIEGWQEPMLTAAQRHLCDEYGFREHYLRRRNPDPDETFLINFSTQGDYAHWKATIKRAELMDAIAHREIKRLDALWASSQAPASE